MKKIFVLAAVAMLMSSAVAFANNGDKKDKTKGNKAKTEKTCKPCPKSCPKPCPPACDKNKCEKS